MVLRLNNGLKIEDLRNHPAETVEKLRALLEAGALAQPDSHRQHFYEVANGSHVFYIYISPVDNRVLLLGTWTKDRPSGGTRAAA